jgi:small conductance mechanosensitive channel
MNFYKMIEDNPWIVNIIYSVVAVIAGFIIYMIINKIFFNIIEDNLKILSNKKSKTFFRLVKSINRYIFMIIMLLVILNINGVDISSLLAGVGIISIIIGFAIQDALKDIIKGFDIIADSYYQVGDVITFENYTGKVLAIGIKTTKIEELYSRNVISLSNRNIEKVEVVSHMINIDIPLSYELKTKDAEEAIEYIMNKIRKIDKVENVEYKGVTALGESNIKYQVKVFCPPVLKDQIRKDSLTCVVKGLEEKNIAIPYNQLDIHQK